MLATLYIDWFLSGQPKRLVAQMRVQPHCRPMSDVCTGPFGDSPKQG